MHLDHGKRRRRNVARRVRRGFNRVDLPLSPLHHHGMVHRRTALLAVPLVVALVGCTAGGRPAANTPAGASLAASVCMNGVVSNFRVGNGPPYTPPSGAEQTRREALNGFTTYRNKYTKYPYELTPDGWAVSQNGQGDVVRILTFTESAPNFYVVDRLISCK